MTTTFFIIQNPKVFKNWTLSWSVEDQNFGLVFFLFIQELENREKDPDEYYETISIHTDVSSTTPKTVKKSDAITRIYACATMWHETRDEMMEMLKSILRMDEDQCARRVAQKYLRVVDPDYYEFESKKKIMKLRNN